MIELENFAKIAGHRGALTLPMPLTTNMRKHVWQLPISIPSQRDFTISFIFEIFRIAKALGDVYLDATVEICMNAIRSWLAMDTHNHADA